MPLRSIQLFILYLCLALTARGQENIIENELQQRLNGYWSLVKVVADDSAYTYQDADSNFRFYKEESFGFDTITGYNSCLQKEGVYFSFGFHPFSYEPDIMTGELTLQWSTCGPLIIIDNRITKSSYSVYHIDNRGCYLMTLTIQPGLLIFEGTAGPWGGQKKSVQVYKRKMLPDHIKKQLEEMK